MWKKLQRKRGTQLAFILLVNQIASIMATNVSTPTPPTHAAPSDELQEVELLLKPADDERVNRNPLHATSGGSRKPRIYRLRAAGANGQFVPRAARLISLPEPEVNSTSELATAPEQQFGTRQSRLLKLVPLKTGSSSSSQNCKEHEISTGSAQHPIAEASSISTSSQTLRLSSRRKSPVSTSKGATATNFQVVVGSSTTAGAAINRKSHNDETPLPGGQTSADNQQHLSARESNILNLIDEFDSKITTNKTQAQLSCDSGEMIVRLNFSEPFKGIVYPDHNRLSPCRFFGDGHLNYELRLPLRGCGTRQVATRVFVNDVIVRFHKTLELEEDEVKTLICRYPPPLDLAPGGSASNYATPTDGQQAEQQWPTGGNRSQLEPFEFVDSNGRPTTTTTSRNQGETLGELRNQQQHQSSATMDINQRPLLAAHDNFRPLGKPITPTNSRLFDPTTTTTTTFDLAATPTSGSHSTFLDRLTSVELLFLISSLMFLVLLALGLVASYFYCWRPHNERRRRRRQIVGHAHHQANLMGAGVLGRRRRYINAPHQSQVSPPPGPTSGQYQTYPHPHYSGTLDDARQYGTAGAAMTQQHRPLYHYQQAAQQYMQQAASSSSPDSSDVSGHVLLPASGRNVQVLRNNGYVPPTHHYKASTIGRAQAVAPPVRGRSEYAPATPHAGTLGRRGREENHFNANLFNATAATSGKANTLVRPEAPGGEPALLKLVDPGHAHPQYHAHSQVRASRSMQQLAEESELLAWHKHHQRLDRFRSPGEPDGGVAGPPPRRSFHAHRQQLVNLETSSSDSELDQNNKTTGEPRLILKSIEDSFVTNLTEVQEQDYRKYDTRRPLSWAEWRTAHAAAANRQSTPGEPDGEGQNRKSDGDSDSQGDGAEGRGERANMRSLTELDVNYAKSLPRLATVRVLHTGTSGANGDGDGDDQQIQVNQLEGVSKVEVSSGGRPAESSPDLIISPEYNFSRFRLISSQPYGSGGGAPEAEVGAAQKRPTSAESHESISYV